MAAAKFDYHAPSSVEEALNLLSGNDDAKILAGGHSLIPMMKTGLAAPGALVDLGKVGGLSYVNESNGGLAIGAMTTYQELATSETVAANAAVLGEAAASVADPQVRNMGTIGGSLAHADPAGDLPAVAVALDAQLVATSSGGERVISADDFFVDLFTTALEPDEILTEIRIPALGSNTGAAYAKMANKASHYAIVGVAAVVSVDDERQLHVGANRGHRSGRKRLSRGRVREQTGRQFAGRRGHIQRRRTRSRRHRTQRGHPRIRRVPRTPDESLRPARHSLRRGTRDRLTTPNPSRQLTQGR